MPMMIPERHDERVALLPIEAPLADLRCTRSAKHVINNRARVPMRLGFICGTQKLQRALNRRHRWSAGERIAIFQQIPVEAISGGRRFDQFAQRPLRVTPFIMKEISDWDAVAD